MSNSPFNSWNLSLFSAEFRGLGTIQGRCGVTGEVWSWWYRESEPVSAPLCTPHATAKPNHCLTHCDAHSWLTLSLSLTNTHFTPFTPFTSRRHENTWPFINFQGALQKHKWCFTLKYSNVIWFYLSEWKIWKQWKQDIVYSKNNHKVSHSTQLTNTNLTI